MFIPEVDSIGCDESQYDISKSAVVNTLLHYF